MKPILFSLLFILSLFAMNLVFPYENQCPPTDAEQASSYQAPAETSANDSKFLSVASDTCLMNPRYFELPPDDYTGSLKDWFEAHPMPKVQACKNCHSIGIPSDNQELYRSRTKQENEQAAYNRMLDSYKQGSENSKEQDKTYTEIVKKYFAEGRIRKP
jgi:hypothetical protein